jgi:HD-GYP domain-containing protein (c-di-GMP phosphodiesterase class II)
MIKILYLHQETDGNDQVVSMINAIIGSKGQLFHTTNQDDAFSKVAVEGPFDLIVFDADDENYDPIFLTEQYLNFCEETSFLYIGSEQNLKQRVDDKLYSEAPVKALTTPVNKDELESILVDLMIEVQKREEQKALVSGSPADFTPLKLRSFYLFKTIPTDAYVKLSDEKYMKVIQKETMYTQAQIQQLARRKVKELHLYRDQAILLLESSMVECIVFIQKQKEPRELLEIFIRSVSLIQSYMRILGISVSVTELTSRLIKRIGKIYAEVGDLKKLLKLFPFQKGDIAEKAILTAFFSEFMLDRIDFKAKASKDKLALAAIMCDCTLENEELATIVSLHDQNLQLFAHDEKKQFEEHPIKASELAQLFTKIPEVDFIIQQHHEMPDGSGFPSGINGQTITTVSAIFIIANNLSTYICKKGLNLENIQSGLNQMRDTHHKHQFRKPFAAICEEFDVAIK